jgi:hypothetical protein
VAGAGAEVVESFRREIKHFLWLVDNLFFSSKLTMAQELHCLEV